MKKNLFLAFLFGISQFGFSQQNTDYQYIIVPKQFSFQKEVNQFNLNILSKFLLEKNNFKCVWDDKIPENSNSCDGLRITKLTLKEIENKIILINENNEEFFSLQKTSLENMYQALRKKDNVSGIFFKKDNHFIFEYNKNDSIIHDFYDVTF